MTITNRLTGGGRTLTTNSDGLFSAPALTAGRYEVSAEAPGFRTVMREAQVLAGTTTNVDFTMTLGETKEVVLVEATNADVSRDSHTVQGSIERQTIQDLPLNGRNFMQLASVQPGITVAPQVMASKNAPIQISILGAPSQSTLLTVDGMTIMDEVDSAAGTAMNLSQEIVQEFQVSSANFDLSTGVTSGGAVNIVTRSGSNGVHGSAYFFYRDHNMAAYPALKRSTVNPNPYFVRRNPGVWLSGPLAKDKLFFFFNYEYQNQVQAVTVQPDLASLASLAGIFSSPQHYTSFSNRFDYHHSANTNMFARYTHDGNYVFGAVSGTPFPSTWSNNTNWSDQSVLGSTTVLTSNLVSDSRFSYRYWHNDAVLTQSSECPNPCFGYGLPQLNMIGSTNFLTGTQGNNPQHLNRRNFETQETISWQRGEHQLKFGGDLDIYTNTWFYGTCTVGCMGVYSVETTRAVLGNGLPIYLSNLSNTIRSNADLLQLPVYFPQPSVTAGFSAGPGFDPGPYHFHDKVRNLRPRIYAQDKWRVRPALTLTYGLSYEVESGLFNSDIPKPHILAPILGTGNLAPTAINARNFGPSFGFAWSLDKVGKTVIRGGGGLYWDTMPTFYRLDEATEIGPVGNGRPRLPSTVFLNIFPGIVVQSGQGHFVPLPIGSPLPLATFTNLTLGQFLQIYDQQYPALSALLSPTSPQTSGPVSISALDLVKSGSELMQSQFPVDRSYQTSIGVQRELLHNFVLSVDWVRRQGENVLQGEVDLNHYNEFVNGLQTPLLPQCASSQLLVPSALCSTGPFQFLMPEGRSIYEGMLLRANNRFSEHFTFLISYALQNLNSNATGGLASSVVNLNNYMQSYGPRLPRHNLNVSGVLTLPWKVQLSLNSSIISRTPITPVTTNIDLSGTGAVNSGPLPGLGYNCGGLSCSKADLANAVNVFNSTYAGTIAPNGTIIPQYVLPPHYQLGSPTISQDIRISKTVGLGERFHTSLFLELFNAFNVANLTGYSFNLDARSAMPGSQQYAFGQPTQRASQIFLSGGPRAEQLGVRFWF